jgi:hypothetical protein
MQKIILINLFKNPKNMYINYCQNLKSQKYFEEKLTPKVVETCENK